MDARDILRRAGYKQLGSGTFAYVYAKQDAPNCLKLFVAKDTAYIEFINLAMSNPNPHFPKFKGKLMKITNHYYAIQMERLSPIDYVEMRTMMYAIDNYTSDIYYSGKASDASLANMEEVEKKQPGITKACEAIATTITRGRSLDMHRGNFMMRGNVLVITDPVAC